MQVTAQLQDKPESAVTVDYDFGDNLDQAVSKFTADVVFSRFKGAAIIDLQALIRRHIKADKKPAEIKEAVAKWKPELRAEGKAPTAESVLSKAQKLSEADRKALIEMLKKPAK